MSALAGMLEWLRAVTPDQLKAYYWAALRIYGTPWFYLLIGVILLLEYLWPAIRDQKLLSRGFVQDFVWFNLDAVVKVAALPAFVGLLQLLYDRVSGGFTLAGMVRLPTLAQGAIALLAFDFLQWFHHWVRHKVTALWHFHVIHHSQRELNLFTDLRVHAVEYGVAQVLTFIPFFLLGLTPYAIMGFGVFMMWYSRLLHANLRTNLGPLKYVLVTPQSHRVHHSIEPRHRDTNFGVLFSVWDRMFGTLYPHYDEYPETGLADVDFSLPPRASRRAWLANIGTQLAYPFRKLLAKSPA